MIFKRTLAATIAAVALAQTAAAAPAPAPAALMFASLQTPDLARAERFYVGALGMKRTLDLSPPDGSRQEIAYSFSGDRTGPEAMLILVQPKAPAPHPASGVRLGLRVPDAPAAVARVRAAGYTVLSDVAQPHGGPVRLALVRDPDGVVVELVETPGQANPGQANPGK